MSRNIGTRIPRRVIKGLEYTGDSQGQATLLISVDKSSFPRIAMISNAEVHVLSDQCLRFAIWQKSSTNQNVLRTKSFVIFRVDQGIPYAIQLRLVELIGSFRVANQMLAMLEARVVGVYEDDVQYAKIINELQFEVMDPPSVVSSWEQIQRLLSGA